MLPLAMFSCRALRVLRAGALGVLLASTLSACVPLVVGGMTAGAWFAFDRRSAGAQIDDEAIEMHANSSITAALQDRGRVTVASYNRVALLTGQVQSAQDRSSAEDAARATANVRHVINALDVGAAVGVTQRAGDALTSTKVKTALVGAHNLKSNAIKVTTENGVTYLMGLVSEQEAKHATEVARGVSGVRKVVQVFEIVPSTVLPAQVPLAPAELPAAP